MFAEAFGLIQKIEQQIPIKCRVYLTVTEGEFVIEIFGYLKNGQVGLREALSDLEVLRNLDREEEVVTFLCNKFIHMLEEKRGSMRKREKRYE